MKYAAATGLPVKHVIILAAPAVEFVRVTVNQFKHVWPERRYTAEHTIVEQTAEKQHQNYILKPF
jgi:hypothetical protein